MIFNRFDGRITINMPAIYLSIGNGCHVFTFVLLRKFFGWCIRDKRRLKPIFSERQGLRWYKDFGNWRLTKVEDMR